MERSYLNPPYVTFSEYMLLLSDAFEDPNSLIDSRMLETNMDLKQKAFTHPEVSNCIICRLKPEINSCLTQGIATNRLFWHPVYKSEKYVDV